MGVRKEETIHVYILLYVHIISIPFATLHVDALSSQPLYTLGGNKHYELLYNWGVSLLHAGHVSKAFDRFTEAAQRLHNNPKVWLRMAECCICSYKCVSND